ncbi:outer membrane protein transport protein [Myxococcota bacterium]|nr:outer membrane protein transport protein [Myxococcota bacterium]
MARSRINAALVVAALFVPAAAHAGGFYVADIGTRGLARGGAFVANPDTLLAMHYNPAGLSHLKGLVLEGDLSLIDLDMTFTRSCPCVDPALPDAAELDQALVRSWAGRSAQTNATHHIPFVGVAYGLPMLDLTLALAAWGPNSGKYELGNLPAPTSPAFEAAARTAVSRYSALTADTLEANYALGFGLQPIAGLRVGGAVMIYQSGNDQDLHLWVNSATFATEPENPGFDVPIALSFQNFFAIDWSLGASYELLPGLTIGGSFRGKRSIRADGTIDVELPELLTSFGAEVTGRDITIELNTPALARFGVEYDMPKVFEAEAAVVWEGWSTYERIVIRPKDIQFKLGTGNNAMTQALGKIVLPRGWQDTVSLRVGGEFKMFDPWVVLSAGYFFEPTAIPANQLDVSRMDADKHGIGLGARTTWRGITLELAGMFILMDTVDVTDSDVAITGPLEAPLGAPTYLTTVGNGTYESSYFISTASLSFALDPLLTGNPAE